MLIMDRDGNSWPSDSEEFAKLKISESFLKELRAKIDDGAEPVVTQVNDCSIIAAQLATELSNCGYMIIALPRYSPESTLINIELIEMLLNQIGLIAKLIEKNNLGNLPVCMAKTQKSLSDRPGLRGVPKAFRVHVNEIRLSAGAGFWQG